MNTVTIVTHNGRFHADDIFAVATIFLFLEYSDFLAWRNKAITIIRTRDESHFATGDFVVDVGGIYDEENNRFDHHQEGGAGMRDNTIAYASFGLVWKKYGPQVSGSQEVADHIDTKLVQAIDSYDNGVPLVKNLIKDAEPYFMHDFISSFLPTWKESTDAIDPTFRDLVEIAHALLKREIKRAQAKIEAVTFVEKSYADAADKRVIVLANYLPWQDVLTNYPEPLFVIYPEPQGKKWHVSTVPQKDELFKTRKDFPITWAGKRDQELQKITGVSDALFCHNKRFLAVAGSKQGALELAIKALND